MRAVEDLAVCVRRNATLLLRGLVGANDRAREDVDDEDLLDAELEGVRICVRTA